MNSISSTDFYTKVNSSKECTSRYARSKDTQIDLLAEDTIHIADDCALIPEAIKKARLQIDSRKWFASKLRPKAYGDKVDITTDGKSLTLPQRVELVVLGGNDKRHTDQPSDKDAPTGDS